MAYDRNGATLNLYAYTAFNLPTQITKTVAGNVTASAEFAYDAGYQRIRQLKRAGPVSSGTFADDILYVVPKIRGQVHLNNPRREERLRFRRTGAWLGL